MASIFSLTQGARLTAESQEMRLCRAPEANGFVLESLMIDRWERKLNKNKERMAEQAGDGDGVSQGPDRKQTAHSSGVTEESLGKGIFTKL